MNRLTFDFRMIRNIISSFMIIFVIKCIIISIIIRNRLLIIYCFLSFKSKLFAIVFIKSNLFIILIPIMIKSFIVSFIHILVLICYCNCSCSILLFHYFSALFIEMPFFGHHINSLLSIFISLLSFRYSSTILSL